MYNAAIIFIRIRTEIIFRFKAMGWLREEPFSIINLCVIFSFFFFSSKKYELNDEELAAPKKILTKYHFQMPTYPISALTLSHFTRI